MQVNRIWRYDIEFLVNSLRPIIDIDLSVFRSDDIGTLFYLLPLIERLTIEIVECCCVTSVETKKQGTIKTIKSLLQELPEDMLVYHNLREKLLDIYSEDGIRNKIIHISLDDKLSVELSEIIKVKDTAIELMALLSTYMNVDTNTVIPDIKPLA